MYFLICCNNKYSIIFKKFNKEFSKLFEFFRGFVDAEGYFTGLTNRNSYSFVFGIGLHVDDLKVLEFI